MIQCKLKDMFIYQISIRILCYIPDPPSRRSKLHRLWSLEPDLNEFVTEPSLGQLGKNASVKVGCSFWASHIPYQSLGQTTLSHTLGARWPSHSVTISNPSQLVGQQAVDSAFRCCRFCVKNRYLKQKPLFTSKTWCSLSALLTIEDFASVRHPVHQLGHMS